MDGLLSELRKKNLEIVTMISEIADLAAENASLRDQKKECGQCACGCARDWQARVRGWKNKACQYMEEADLLEEECKSLKRLVKDAVTAVTTGHAPDGEWMKKAKVMLDT